MTLWAAASGSAEFFADIALCPFEMTFSIIIIYNILYIDIYIVYLRYFVQ